VSPHAGAELLFERGREHVARGDAAAAVAAYSEAVRLDPAFGRAYLALAELRRALRDDREAELLLTRATALPDVRAEAFSRRARLYSDQGRAELALRDLRQAVEVEPSFERVRELSAFYVARRAWLAALSTWRLFRAELEGRRAPENSTETGEMIAALTLLAAEADPAQHDMGDRNWIRGALRHQVRQSAGTHRLEHPRPR
jgi:tetratricopeptide (TPR) repeat protein